MLARLAINYCITVTNLSLFNHFLHSCIFHLFLYFLFSVKFFSWLNKLNSQSKTVHWSWSGWWWWWWWLRLHVSCSSLYWCWPCCSWPVHLALVVELTFAPYASDAPEHLHLAFLVFYYCQMEQMHTFCPWWLASFPLSAHGVQALVEMMTSAVLELLQLQGNALVCIVWSYHIQRSCLGKHLFVS